MCFEFEAEYYRRMEDARKAFEAEQKRKEGRPAAPPQPAEPDRAREQGAPVPV
jgi:hypothetical protein